jgi:alkanesulfonate monooxygenase SsuD/methylene tetrahydromethanopterin reductase-like flavin-dependent oxidoreductase (luciferase family)
VPRPPLRIGVVYDFRNPPGSEIDTPRLYAEILEQVVWLDGLGLDLVWFTEHHFVEDGYLPSWTPVAGAMAARTRRVRFSSDICLLPFNHPLRLAEDLAVLDNLSGGRVELGVGMGYAPHEFRGFGQPLPQRVSRTEEGLEVLRRCFTGERFSFHGTRYHFDDVIVRPRYLQPGGPPLWLAAMSAGGARRAAKFDCHLLPQGPRDQTLEPWRKALTDFRPATGSASSGAVSSPTTASATGRPSGRPSATAASSMRGSSPRPAASSRSSATGRAFHRRGW